MVPALGHGRGVVDLFIAGIGRVNPHGEEHGTAVRLEP